MNTKCLVKKKKHLSEQFRNKSIRIRLDENEAQRECLVMALETYTGLDL